MIGATINSGRDSRSLNDISREINDEGTAVFERMYSQDDVSLLRRICDSRFNAFKRDDKASKPFIRDDNAWITNYEFRRRLFSDKLFDVASEVFETKKIRLYHTAALYKEPGDSIVGWHQDSYISPLDCNLLTAWIPLVDMPDDKMGTMLYAAGSHRSGVLPPPETISLFTAESDQYYESLISKEALERRSFPVRAGDVIFHHGATLHMSTPNISDHTREALTIFLYPDGGKIMPPTNSFKVSERRLYFPGLLPGDTAASPLNPLFYHSSLVNRPARTGEARGWIMHTSRL